MPDLPMSRADLRHKLTVQERMTIHAEEEMRECVQTSITYQVDARISFLILALQGSVVLAVYDIRRITKTLCTSDCIRRREMVDANTMSYGETQSYQENMLPYFRRMGSEQDVTAQQVIITML